MSPVSIYKCPRCGEPVVRAERADGEGETVRVYPCGHMLSTERDGGE